MNGPPGDDSTSLMADAEALRREPPPELPRISQVGRYVLLKQLGQGGMGVVFAAYDPDLDRKVALKLLRPDARTDSEQARARLLREAQAMARVSHPHVIPIFDVGVWGQQVFLAMELIDGGTLSDWLKGAQRSWREVLEKFLGAGRGLLAAHEAGLVHRDFKPGNVLVSHAGRVSVTDFGLARQVGPSGAEPAPEAPRPAELEHRMLDVSLTEPGVVMGTPNYMSPEQFRGEDVDARSDQFSFCVSLYWALYRQRPFDPGRMRAALLTESDTQPPGGAPTKPEGLARRGAVIQEPPRDVKVPAWVRQAVMRGLSVDPDARFPSMKELLEALSQERRQVRRRRWVVAAIAGVEVLLLGGGVAYQRARACTGAGELMAQVWSPAARQGVEDSFLATGTPFAGERAQRVLAALDGYAREWTQQRTEVCEATRRGVQTEELRSLREVCLERRRRDVRALVDVFHRADGPLLSKALEAVDALPALSECAEVESLAEQQRLPADPGKRAEIEALVDRVAEVKALVDAGRYTVAKEKAEALGAAVEGTGHLPLMAELHTYRGWLKEQLGQSEEAVPELVRAVHEAEAGRADRLKVDILTRLLFVEDGLRRFDVAEGWAGWAEATLRRLGGDAVLESILLINRGNMEVSRGRLPEARAHFEKARALLERALPPGHSRRARATFLLGSVVARQGDVTRGVEMLEEALAQTEAAVGTLHPDMARRHATLAWALREAGQLERSLEHARAAVRIREAVLGPDHRQTTGGLAEVGQTLLSLGRYAEALEVYREALARQLRVLKPGDGYLQYSYDGVGQALLGLGRAREAIAPLQQAVAFEASQPEDLAESGFALARALVADGRGVEARFEAQRARERFTQAGKAPRAAEVLTWLEAQTQPAKARVRR